MIITGAQKRSDLPRGTRSRALAQSTQHWWKIRPVLHLGKRKIYLFVFGSQVFWIYAVSMITSTTVHHHHDQHHNLLTLLCPSMTTMTRRLAAVPVHASTLAMLIVVIILMMTLMAVTKRIIMMMKCTKSIVADLCRESASSWNATSWYANQKNIALQSLNNHCLHYLLLFHLGTCESTPAWAWCSIAWPFVVLCKVHCDV